MRSDNQSTSDFFHSGIKINDGASADFGGRGTEVVPNDNRLSLI